MTEVPLELLADYLTLIEHGLLNNVSLKLIMLRSLKSLKPELFSAYIVVGSKTLTGGHRTTTRSDNMFTFCFTIFTYSYLVVERKRNILMIFICIKLSILIFNRQVIYEYVTNIGLQN